MTVIRPNSISGITSITGFGGDISIFRADGTAADVTVNNITSGVITATTFKGAVEGNVTGAVTGSGANLTSIPAAQLTGTVADARLSTVSSSKLSGALPALDGSALTGVGVGTADSINTSGIITATAFAPTGGQLSHRNIIINGAMTISQRGTSFAFDGYGIDRFWWGMFGRDQAVTTRTQSTDAPSGFKNSQKLVVNTAETSLDSGERAYIRYRIEGQDLQQLGTGASGAKKLTLSFYAKSASNNSGHQYSVYLSNHDISGNDRIQTRSFTVTSTWQRFTFTFDGQEDISIRNDNDYGLQLFISLSAYSSYEASAITSWTNSTYKVVSGQSNFLASTSNEFYLTGVQLEVGPVATPFEHRSFGEELIRCKRYFNMVADGTEARSGSSRSEGVIGNGFFWSSSRMMVPVKFQVAMRTPNWSLYKKNGEYRYYANGGSNQTCTQNDIGLNGQEGLNSAHLNITNISSSSAAGMFFVHDINAALGFDAEL